MDGDRYAALGDREDGGGYQGLRAKVDAADAASGGKAESAADQHGVSLYANEATCADWD